MEERDRRDPGVQFGEVDRKQVDVASVIFAYRIRAGWSQKELACRSGVHNVTISKIESAQVFPRGTTLRKLADAFGVHVRALLDDTNVPKLPSELKVAEVIPMRANDKHET